MARTKKPRKRYRGRDAAQPAQIIRIEAKDRSKLENWWIDHKQVVIIRLIQAAVLLIVYGVVRLVWSLLT